jgi:hypothetical protein
MTFTINMTCDNDAFQDGALETEVARILREIIAKLENEGPSGFYETIFDENGNDVGRWRLK